MSGPRNARLVFLRVVIVPRDLWPTPVEQDQRVRDLRTRQQDSALGKEGIYPGSLVRRHANPVKVPLTDKLTDYLAAASRGMLFSSAGED